MCHNSAVLEVSRPNQWCCFHSGRYECVSCADLCGQMLWTDARNRMKCVFRFRRSLLLISTHATSLYGDMSLEFVSEIPGWDLIQANSSIKE